MKARDVLLGYEVGTGKPVELPIRNMVVTGQTQESGKTTTLEALVARSGVTALTFITKPGERSFASGRRIQPYFRDRADWQFVDQLLAAQLAEKNKFLRPWIMKICRSTNTLAEVQERVREALLTAKGINEGVYTQLDEYLNLIVPEIENAELAEALDLQPGLNVMDVTDFRTPMQMLFVQSALDWVNERCRDTIVVIPEAWEFVPQQKGSPVKASAEKLVRRGSGIGNRIWVDSQDTAGIDNLILRGCPVWLMGVQRQIDEIKRNIANIPAGLTKPKPADIALLELGQFFACFGKTTVKVYVQPAWMNDAQAQAIARGELSVDDATIAAPAMAEEAPAPRQAIAAATAPVDREEDEVTREEADALRAENSRLKVDAAAADQRGFDRGMEAGLRQAGQLWNASLLDLRDKGQAVVDVAEHLATVAREGRWSVPLRGARSAVAETSTPAAAAPDTAPRVGDAPKPPSSVKSPPGALDLAMLEPLVRSHPLAIELRLWALALGIAEGTTKSGPWHKKVRALTEAGYLEKAGAGFRATEAGVAACGAAPANPEDETDLWALWRIEIAKEVGESAMAMLRVLSTTYQRHRLTNEQLALLAGKSPGTAKSGPWFVALRDLRDWGLIEGDRLYAMTPKGMAVLGDSAERVLSDAAEALRQARYRRLELAKRHYDALTRPMTRGEIGEVLGVGAGTMKSGPWHRAIKEMIDAGLVADEGGTLRRIGEELASA